MGLMEGRGDGLEERSGGKAEKWTGRGRFGWGCFHGKGTVMERTKRLRKR